MNPSSQPPHEGRLRSQSDAIDGFIIFIDAVMDNTIRPARRNIPFMPPDAYDLPPMPEKPITRKPEDGPKDGA